MDALRQDLWFAIRVLAQRPGSTLVILLALGLGIGANTAVFSVVRGTVLQAVPYLAPERLVTFETREARRADGGNLGVSVAEYFDWLEQCDAYTDIGVYHRFGYNLTGGDRPERVEVIRATASVLSALGVNASLGRTFGPAEDTPQAERVALLSAGFWRRYFNGDRAVIGRTIALESTPHTVLGVLPPELERELGHFDLWTPLRADPARANRGGVGWVPIARLKPGVSQAQAQEEMNAVAAWLAQVHPQLNPHTVSVVPLLDTRFSERDEAAMLILAATVGVVLLVACANVANLLLAKAVGRRGELAVRAALGASRWQLIRQLLTEGVLLALAGGGVGALLACWGTELVRAPFSDSLTTYNTGIDASVLAFTLAVSVLTVFVFGLAPAVLASAVNLSESLKPGIGSISAHATGWRGRDLLLVGQVAMAFATVVCAALLIRSFVTLRHVDPGFDTKNLLTMEVSVDRNKYPGNYMHRVKFFDAVLERIRQTPGITAVAAAQITPLIETDHGNGVVVEGYEGPVGGGEIMVDNVIVTPGYFETLGVPLIRGRSFTAEDVYGADEVMIVSRRAAQEFWPDEDPIGKRIRYGWSDGDQPWVTVVGVVGDITQHGLGHGRPLQVYRTLSQGGSYTSHLTVVARTAAAPLALGATIRAAVWEIDPDQPAFCVRSMKQIVTENTRDLRSLALLLSAFSGGVLVLAAVGLYGALSYTVSRRTREIGIRMALGARAQTVIGPILARSVVLTLIGSIAGVAVASVLGHTFRSLMFGVTPTDPATFAIVGVAMVAVALLASYVPARRAAKVDPLAALRCE